MARSYVLDTHTCVFMLAAPKRLGSGARAALRRVEAGREEAWLAAAVVAEVLLLRGLGRVGVGLPELRRAMESAPSLHFSTLDLDQLDQFSSLGSIPDPFDRLIVSAARSKGAILITRDAAIAEGGLVETLW